MDLQPTLERRGCVLLTLLTLVVLPLLAPRAAAQSININGFIKSSYYYDSRQVVDVREGDFLLWPLPEEVVDGEDINDTDNLLFFPFFSRIALSIGDLPQVGGATVTGLIETDFFGPGNPDLNNLRMRRGFVRLDWGEYEALFGMEWSPLFLSSWAPTIATEAGAPFNPFARFPQIRFTLKPENFRLSGILAQQRDAFQEIGGLKQQQQAGVPAVMVSAEYIMGNSSIGANGYVKWIRPELASDRFSAPAIQGFVTLAQPTFEVRANVTYGGDLADHLMTGGYAILGPDEFEPLYLWAAWGDIQSVGTVSVGIFAGYLQNLGTMEENIDVADVTFVARAPNIDTIWRVAPRVAYNVGRVRFAGEVQVTTADFAAAFDDTLAPTGDTESFTNVRANFTVFLFF